MAERDAINTVRAVGGLLAIITLLSLIVADFAYADLTLSQRSIYLLVGMISSLLGIDMLVRNGSITFKKEQ